MSSTIELTGDKDIQIHAMPTGGRPVKMDVAVKIDGNTVFRDANGKLYSPSVRDGCYYGVSNWNWTKVLNRYGMTIAASQLKKIQKAAGQ